MDVFTVFCYTGKHICYCKIVPEAGISVIAVNVMHLCTYYQWSGNHYIHSWIYYKTMHPLHTVIKYAYHLYY